MNPYLHAYVHHLPRVVAKTLVGKRYVKDSASVFAHYEAMRQKALEQWRADRPSLASFVTDYATTPQLQLNQNRPTWDIKAVRLRFIGDLADRILRYGAKSVVEIGSGHGRNILALKDRLPDVSFSGLELSPSGVQMSHEAASFYGLQADFRQFDATGDWSTVPQADLFYTVHTLEQMQYDAPNVIDRMVEKAQKAVVMIEPFPDFWTGVKGLARKVRAIDSHRLKPGSFSKYSPVEARSLDYGDAINHPSLVVLEV